MTRVVVAPAAFKGAASAAAAAAAVARGVRRTWPQATVREVPVADGGEGTLDALVAARSGEVESVAVADPLGRTVTAQFGVLPGGVVVIELARASGYERLVDAERDPERTSTFGTGQLLRAALDRSPRQIIVTLGGSATNDGGLGLLRALGVRILDGTGRELAGCGADLSQVASLDVSGLDPRLRSVAVDVACDVRNPFFGPQGAAHVFGPQKGADLAMVARLDEGMVRVARVFEQETGVDVQAIPGSGAAGGVAGGMAAVLGARIVPGAHLVLAAVGLRQALVGATVCVTGEGRLDDQTREGKAPAAVAALCRELDVPCVALCGELGLTADAARAMGFVAALTIGQGSTSLADALAATPSDLEAMGARLGTVRGNFTDLSPPSQ